MERVLLGLGVGLGHEAKADQSLGLRSLDRDTEGGRVRSTEEAVKTEGLVGKLAVNPVLSRRAGILELHGGRVAG